MSLFKRAREVNAIYGDTYGGRKAPDNPEWTGVAGDIAARTRANFPSPAAQKYFAGPLYNQYVDMLVTTGNQGKKPGQIGDKVYLRTTDDITAKPVYEKQRAQSTSSANTDWMVLVFLLVGTFAFIIYLR